MKLFRLKIPKQKAQEVRELESWTVSWEVPQSIMWVRQTITLNKCFIDKKEAKEFKKQLEESAKFIGFKVFPEIKKN